MNTYPYILLTFMLALGGCKSIGEKPRNSDLAGVYYRIKPKDTLSQIAKKHRVTIDEIKDVNGIDDERALKIGQAIFLPDPDPIGKKIDKLKPKTVAKKGAPAIRPPKKATETKVARTFDFPVPGGTIIHTFSKAKDNPYDGIGIKAPLGSKVVSSQDGNVLFVGDDGTRFGLLVIIEHAEPYITVYTQLDKAIVTAGQKLKKGQQLGMVGKSGGAAIPHLHFQIRVNKRPQDPKAYLKGF
jgi:murein DD-endopeptidase MepM/ murein hydrolase activator NlpD